MAASSGSHHPAPDALRQDYAAFLAKYHEEFRAEHRVTNGQCDMQSVPYMAMSYTLDKFDTPEDAAAALKDGFLQQMETVSGYTENKVDGMDFPVYTQAKTVCNVDATQALTFWQRGHYVVTAQVTFPTSSQAAANLWLTRLVGIAYESIFSEVLMPEVVSASS